MQEQNFQSSEPQTKRFFRLKPNERYPDCSIETIDSEPELEEQPQLPSLSSKEIRSILLKKSSLSKATLKWCEEYHKRQQELEENTYQLREFKALEKMHNSLFEKEKEEVMPFLARFNIADSKEQQAEALMDSSSMDTISDTTAAASDIESHSEFIIYKPETVKKDSSINISHSRRSWRAPGNGIVATVCGIILRSRDLRTLFPNERVNDQIINVYMSLIVERNNNDEALPKVYCTNSFFYEQLKLGRFRVGWTKQINIFQLDLLIVPLFVAGHHWALAVVDIHRRVIEYYDSLGLPHSAIISPLRRFLILHQRYEGRQVKPFMPRRMRVPRQKNTMDCGVFLCQYAEHVARQCSIRFTQEDVQELRKKMMQEILVKELMT